MLIDLKHNEYQAKVIANCQKYLDVREEGRNLGEEVEEFQRLVRIRKGSAWCGGFAYAMHYYAAEDCGGKTSCPRTGGAVSFYINHHKRHGMVYRPEHVIAGLVYPQPGDLYCRTRMGKAADITKILRGLRVPGHVGVVQGFDAENVVHTIDGNTNPGGSREGDGVYARKLHLDMPELFGFVRPQLMM